MRSDRVKYWLETDEWINPGTDEWMALSNEDKMIVGMINKAASDGAAASFNSLYDSRYGKQPTGGGEELTGGSEVKYNVTFRGVKIEEEDEL